jgi:hypothetical protein
MGRKKNKKHGKASDEISIVAFEFDGAWHASVYGPDGEAIHTTEAWPTRDDALWAADDALGVDRNLINHP